MNQTQFQALPQPHAHHLLDTFPLADLFDISTQHFQGGSWVHNQYRLQVNQTAKLVESKEREVRIIKESVQREKEMGKLLSTLNEEKAAVMQSLLESVQTTKLQAAFDKYLPAVLNTGAEKKPAKAIISESIVEATGNKTAKKEVEVEARDNVIDIKRLAGL